MKRYVGGIAYPFMSHPGYYVLILIEKAKPWRFKIVEEGMNNKLPELYQTCLSRSNELRENENATCEWYGDALNPTMTDLIYQSLPKASDLLYIPAPYIEDENHTILYLQILKEMTDRQKKVLFFGERSYLPGEMRSYDKEDKRPIEETPPLAALSYAASALYLWLQEEERKSVEETDALRIIDKVTSESSSDDDFPY